MSDDDGMKITIEGKEFSFDDFELGELEWLEDELGGLTDDKLNTIKAAVRFVYLIKKRDDPEFTMSQARKINLGSLDDTPSEPEKRPTKAARSKAASSTRAKSGETS